MKDTKINSIDGKDHDINWWKMLMISWKLAIFGVKRKVEIQEYTIK